jgi:dTDP-4-amino-4,6-dideoxygalactose transaminase
MPSLKHRGIGSEFGLSPRLLETSASDANLPFRHGRTLWLNSGRAGLKWAVRTLRSLESNRSICLLPAYLCPSVLQPFVEVGAEIEFYRVDHNLQICWDDLLERINSDTLAVLIIHYFGIPQPPIIFDQLRAVAPDVYIIEDLTHAWLSQSLKDDFGGRQGAITIYSPRKFFPVPDAGIVVVDADKIDLDAEVSSTNWGFTLRRTIGLIFRWLFSKSESEMINCLAFYLLHDAERKLDAEIAVSESSWISRRIMSNIDFYAAAAARRRNYAALDAMLQTHEGLVRPFYKCLPVDVTPLGYPILCKKRDRLKDFLIQQHVYPPIHWVLPSDKRIAEFVHLVELSRDIMTLPIDQRYSLEDMRYISDCLKEWEKSEE